MQAQEKAGLNVQVDQDGFLVRPEDWTEAVAREMAAREGIDLTEDRMDILKFLRLYYAKYQFFPIVRSVCKNAKQPRNCMTEKLIDAVMAWKLAGLPNPGEEVIGFHSWEPLGF